MTRIMQGKRVLVTGLANHRSIAWGVAQAWHEEGAEVLVSCLDRFCPSIHKLLASSWPEAASAPEKFAIPCDVTDEASVHHLFDRVKERFNGRLDGILHSIAYASPDAMKGDFIDTTATDFAQAHLISAYALISLSRAASPLMTAGEGEAALPLMPAGGGSSIITLSYLGSNRVVPNYKVMSAAKASLESSCRVLAHELGPKGIRVNCISPGPVQTLAARGITGFTDLYKGAAEKAPLRRHAGIGEVGALAAFLASDKAKSITGQTIYVDGGVSILAP